MKADDLSGAGGEHNITRFIDLKALTESEAADIACGLSLLPFPRKWSACSQFNFPDILYICVSAELRWQKKRHCLFSSRGQIQ